MNSEFCLDAHRFGNKTQFINHSSDAPNIEARYLIVDASYRVGFFSNHRIASGSELSFDYNYASEHRKSIGDESKKKRAAHASFEPTTDTNTRSTSSCAIPALSKRKSTNITTASSVQSGTTETTLAIDNENVLCKCGVQISSKGLKKHMQSQYHADNLKKKLSLNHRIIADAQVVWEEEERGFSDASSQSSVDTIRGQNRDRPSPIDGNMIVCECGRAIGAAAMMKRHYRTSVHINNMKKMKQNTIINQNSRYHL